MRSDFKFKLQVMPFAPKIRKEILKALDESIIPALKSREVAQFLAAPPFDFSKATHWAIHQELLPDKDKGPLQIIRKWPEHQLVAARGLFLSFLYEGEMHEKVGILEGHRATLQNQEVLPGIQIIKLSAPSSIVFADFAPRGDGVAYPEMLTDRSRAIRISFDKKELTTSYSYRGEGQRESSHHLQIYDDLLMQLGSIYLEEMRQNSNPALGQTLLLAIMYRLQHNLRYKRPEISNSCWVGLPVQTRKPATKTELRHQELCEEVIDYIQNNLHRPLSVSGLAQHFRISSFHLNKIFRQVHGITIMRFVTALRVDVAKRILIEQNEQIRDIARLTGFASPASFSHVFRNQTGFSPSEFRSKNR